MSVSVSSGQSRQLQVAHAALQYAVVIPRNYSAEWARQSWLERQERYRVNAAAFERGMLALQRERMKPEPEPPRISIDEKIAFENEAYLSELVAEAKRVVDKCRPKRVRAETIQLAVCEYLGMTRAQLLSKDRHSDLCRARQIGYWLCRELTSFSLPEIGRRFNRDHTTALSGIRKIARLLETDEKLSTDIAAIRERLAGLDGG